MEEESITSSTCTNEMELEATATSPLDENVSSSSDVILTQEEKIYKVVEKLFVNGMKRSSDHNIVVTGIRKCLYSRRRLRVFEMTAGMTKEERGEANVRFGWYGAAKEDVDGVSKHGFGRTNDGVLGVENAHGVGVHLSPPHFPYAR